MKVRHFGLLLLKIPESDANDQLEERLRED